MDESVFASAPGTTTKGITVIGQASDDLTNWSTFAAFFVFDTWTRSGRISATAISGKVTITYSLDALVAPQRLLRLSATRP